MEFVADASQAELAADTQRRVEYLNGARDEWENRLIAGFPVPMSPNVPASHLSDEDTRRENMYEDRGL